MDEKDKEIIKGSALAIADQIASTIPPLSIAWGLAKAWLGAPLKLRQQKALEWVEMVRDNLSDFTEEILKNEKFQDGFVFALEKYLQERSEEKRRVFRRIFLGYTKAEDQESFPLEKFLSVLNVLTLEEVRLLTQLRGKENKEEYFQPPIIYPETSEAIHHLIQNGILITDPNSRWGPIEVPFIRVTTFGRQFIQYLEK